MGKKRKKSTNNGTYKNRKTRNKTVEKRGNKDAKAKRKDTKMKLKYKHPKLALFLKIILIIFVILIVIGAGVAVGLIYGLYGEDFSIVMSELIIP